MIENGDKEMTIARQREYTAKAKLFEIREDSWTAKNGNRATIITLVTDKGRFTAHKGIFDRQHLPLENLTEGNILTIRYTVYQKGERAFKNFRAVSIENADNNLTDA